MATKRRTVRERKTPVKYFKEDSSDEDEDNDNENTKAAKLKLKQMMNEDSDAESDFETELKAGKTALHEEESSSEDEGEEEEVQSSKLSKVGGGDDKSLCLSESDSSDDEKTNVKILQKKDIVSVVANTDGFGKFSLFDEDVEEESLSSQKLLALAGNLERMKDVWKEKENLDTNSVENINDAKEKVVSKKRTKKTQSGPKTSKSKASHPPSISNLDDSVSKLLAFGEGVSEDIAAVGEDESENTVASPSVPKEGVEITIAVPEHLRKRKKKKGFDVAAFLKREISRARRELAVLMHKSHLTCLVANLIYLNRILSTNMLQGLALSIVPTNHSHKPKDLTLTRLASMVTWVREAIPVNRHSMNTKEGSITSRLTRGLETLLVMSDMEQVVMFVLICRALGYNTRLVINCDTVSLKPSNDTADKQPKIIEIKENPDDIDPSTSKSTGGGGDKSKAKKKKSSCVTRGSDSEGEAATRKAGKDSKSKLSSKLAAAAKARTSNRMSAASASKNIEEEIIKKLEKNPSKRTKLVDSKTSNKENKKENKSSTKSKAKPSVPSNNHWAEIYLEKERKWIPVDLSSGKVNNPSELERLASRPMLYVLAINNKGRIKDVTQRYASNYLTQTRKMRVDQDWLDATLNPFMDKEGEKEDKELAKKMGEAPLPTNVGAFKGHPLYALERHLLKFEAIYPPAAPTLGFIRGEGVYARECVHTLQGRTSWLKEGRTVRLGEEPYKVVKARPKWDRMTGSKVTEEPLDLFGQWQTELYIPPPAKDGKVPRNEYGNVELFKPWMLPAGCVQIPINGMSRVIRKTGIDAAPAMVGWDFSGGGAHPVYDGYVVCEENAEALMDAWNAEQEDKIAREESKREKRVLENWKKLVKGLMFREKMKNKYLKD